jgi:tetratricopeptide (TPR) repeat protein
MRLALLLICFALDAAANPAGRAMNLEREATALYEAGRYAEAELRQKKAILAWREVAPRVSVAIPHANLAGIYLAQGKLSAAEREMATALREEEQNPTMDTATRAWVRTRVAKIHLRSGRIQEAVAEQEGALATLAQTEDGVGLATLLNDLGMMQAAVGDLRTARSSFARALQAGGSAADPMTVGLITGNLALACMREGDLVQAEAYYSRAVTLLEQSLGPDHPNVRMLLKECAELLRRTGRKSEAKAIEQRMKAIPSSTHLAERLTVDVRTLREESRKRR